MKSTLKKGRTITELLIVLAVLSVLAILALPVLGGDEKPDPRAACAANLKSIGQALKMYAADHNDALPPRAASFAASTWAGRYGDKLWDTANGGYFPLGHLLAGYQQSWKEDRVETAGQMAQVGSGIYAWRDNDGNWVADAALDKRAVAAKPYLAPEAFVCPADAVRSNRYAVTRIKLHFERDGELRRYTCGSHHSGGSSYALNMWYGGTADGLRDGPYGGGAEGNAESIVGGGQAKLSVSAEKGYIAAADSYNIDYNAEEKKPVGLSESNTAEQRRHHVGPDGLPEGVNVLFFNGSVRWVPAGPLNENGMPANLAGSNPRHLENNRAADWARGSIFRFRQDNLPE
jgi:competence protein ComGC